MKLIRMLGVAALSAILVATSATGAVAGDDHGSPGAGFTALGDSHGSPSGGFTATSEAKAADTPDGTPVGVVCGGDRYGSFNWNDYADDDHGKDIDNVTVYDQPGDGYSLRVVVTNSSNGRVESGTATYGGRLSIDVGNVKNGDHVSVTGVPWKAGSPVCSPYTYATFYE